MANMQELLSQRFEAQRQKLVSMDIVAVAESLGMKLKPGLSGAYYWEEHDSFHIYPNTNTFRWWSRGVGTNTIDLVQVVQEEMTGHKPSFREATSFLETGHFDNVTVQPVVKEPFEYYLERYEHSDFNIGRQYLKEERGLSDETINTFLASGNLAATTRKKGDYFEPVIVFKSRDNDGKMIGASLQGIVENRVQHPERGRLKQIMKNSEGTAGFSLDIGTPKRLVFTEAPIDLMSYYEVNKDDLQDVKIVAMDGLKKGVVSRYVADLLTDGKYSQTMSRDQIRGALDALNQTTNLLQEHPDMITLAVDNDEAGRRFVSDLQEDGIPVVADLPPRQATQDKMDWNDYLKQMKKESTQMAENQEKSGVILPEKNINGVEQKSLESFSDTQKEHIREFFKTRVSDIKTDYIYLPNGQEDLGYYLDGYLFAHHYAELDMLSPSKQVDALMERVSEHDQKFLEEHFGYQPDTPIEEYRQSEKNSDRIVEKEEQDFRNQFDRQSFAETIGLMQKYSPEEVLNESNSYHDDVRYQSLLVDLEKVDTNSLYRFIERYIDRDIDREVLSQFSTQDFITIAKEHELLNETPSVEPWKAITVTQPVNRYTVLTDKASEEFDNVSDLHQFVNQSLKRSQRQELSSLLSEPGRGTPLDTLMAIDSVAGDVEVNGQSILSLFPDGINEEATEIYSRSSAEIEAAASVEASPAEKEAVGELKSYGTFIIDDDFLERRYGSVDKEKSLETTQETVDSHSGQEKMDRSKTSLGSLEGNPPGSAEPVSETDTFEQAVTSHPTFSYPLLQFSTEEAFVSNVRESYHIATQADIRSLNYYAPSLQQTANWYRDNLADSQITYMLKGAEGVKALQVNFAKDKFAHLTGIRPVGRGLSAEKLLDDFAEGRGHYPNLTLSNGFNDKIQVLPMLQELSQSKAFIFSDLSEVEKMKNLNASHAIQSNNRSLVVALKTIDNVTFPSSLLKGKKKLTNELIEKANENDILGVVREKEGVVSVLSVNDNFIKDGGEELRLMVERKQFEEVEALKARTKDSDGDGLTDDEEIALGTNPYSPDTDGDGVIDSIERGSGTDATNLSDTPDNRQKEQMKHNLTLSEMIKAKDTAALNQHLQEGIKDYFDSDTYKNYLEGMAHFNHYSARNIQLIKAQLPEATMVASFEEWKKRNGHVNKGEKALYVQAPVTVIKKDADGNPVVNSETGEKETFTYFKPVPVFDISQISPQQGKQLNLPKSSEAIPAQLNKDYYQNVYRALRDISQKENGIPIRFRELEQSDGFYNPKTNDITIKKGMTYEQTLSTLIHEMAHSELHNKKSLTERFEGKLTRSSEELQAESIAYVVSNHLGFDTSNDSFAYLASWSKEADGLENLKAQLEIVQEEASSLMNRIDKQLTKYQTLTVSKDDPLTETQKRNLEKSANPFYQSLQKAKAEINNMKKGDEPSNEKTVKKDNRPTKC
ncbi:PBECR4 domain-containing protein [Streptococcus gallolyticus]|uniref:PBECR4 domain-containing protein n=1 Tax=Streptococcus gallolyticus TaxID=315405 RepID=UPI00088C5810|nr:PBECR4 domain-containing protein [Streptococcus gallolyticus]SDJ59818.1 DNA primase [Streptococcus gallolyticus]SDL08307.1 DNA primase [Streptococcus gallolyticus]